MDELKSLSAATLYALAIIIGMLGGCASGLYYYTHVQHARWGFVLAYILLGGISGVATLAGAAALDLLPGTVHQAVLLLLLSGSAGSIAIFSANWTVRLIFQRLGLEVQVTMRRDSEERRAVEKEAGD